MVIKKYSEEIIFRVNKRIYKCRLSPDNKIIIKNNNNYESRK